MFFYAWLLVEDCLHTYNLAGTGDLQFNNAVYDEMPCVYTFSAQLIQHETPISCIL